MCQSSSVFEQEVYSRGSRHHHHQRGCHQHRRRRRRQIGAINSSSLIIRTIKSKKSLRFCFQNLDDCFQEKDLQILELSELIAEKRDFIGRLYFEINEKEDRLVEMANEIKKRKHDMNEMSRRIIEMDQEVKFYQNFDYKQQSVQLSRSCSHIESGKKTIRSTRWKRMIALR